MIEIKNLTASYDGVAAVSDVNLKVMTGEIYTIVGPSGCGKSTLLKATAGLLNICHGEVLFNGEKVDNKRHTIGYVPQSYGLLPWKTVGDNIATALKVKKKKLEQNDVLVIDMVLKKVGLLDTKTKFPNDLSGGQQQRVAIARAFALEPDLLLLDEPFSALDAMTKEDMQAFFLEVWAKAEAGAALFITHDIEEAVYLGHKVVVMLPGRIVEVLASPSSDRGSAKFVQLCAQIRRLIREGAELADE